MSKSSILKKSTSPYLSLLLLLSIHVCVVAYYAKSPDRNWPYNPSSANVLGSLAALHLKYRGDFGSVFLDSRVLAQSKFNMRLFTYAMTNRFADEWLAGKRAGPNWPTLFAERTLEQTWGSNACSADSVCKKSLACVLRIARHEQKVRIDPLNNEPLFNETVESLESPQSIQAFALGPNEGVVFSVNPATRRLVQLEWNALTTAECERIEQ